MQYIISVVCSSTCSREIVEKYVCRPLPGIRFRQAISQIASGRQPLPASHARLGREVADRAARLLRWIDGKESDARTPHDVLGLSSASSAKQIQQQYRKISKRVHPDLHPPGRQDYWLQRQREVNEAYQALTDPEARARWFARIEERNRLLRRLWEIEKPVRR